METWTFTINTDGSGLLQLTNEQGEDFRPEWLPDGRCLTFYVSRPSPTGGGYVYTIRNDGTGLVELTTLR
jgi:Tol biopolymer transport system component